MPTLKRKQAETLRFSWNIPLGSVITGWWSGNGLGKYRTQETNQTQRHRALAGAPKRGDALTVPRSRRLIQREHHPRGAAGGSLQQAEGQVAAGPQQSEERSLWTRRGDRQTEGSPFREERRPRPRVPEPEVTLPTETSGTTLPRIPDRSTDTTTAWSGS